MKVIELVKKGFVIEVKELVEERSADCRYTRDHEVVFRQTMPLGFSVAALARFLNDIDPQWALARHLKTLEEK